VPNAGVPNFINTLLDLKKQTKHSHMGRFNTPLLPIERSFRQKKEILELNDTIDEMDLIAI
jgi:hypothetical protein